MKPRVFISHSCKDANAGEPPAPAGTNQARRQDVLAYSRNVRARVVKKLKRKGYEVWLDQSGLLPGEDWRAKLHRWLGTCDAAVVLLDEESVRSSWLLKEATILAWRRDIGADIAVMPALLGDFKASAIDASPLKPIGLDWSQSASIAATDRTDASAELLARKIVRSLPHLTRSEPDTDMEDWVGEVRGILDQINPVSYLHKAADRLGVARDDWIDAGDDDAGLTATLAHHLLYMPLDAVLAALETLRRGLPQGKLPMLVDLVSPIWVDAFAAQCLNAFVAEVPPPVVVLAAGKFDTARDHVLRARFCQDPPERVIHGQLPTGTSPGVEAGAAFLEAMCLHWNKQWPGDRDIVVAALQDTGVRRYVVFGPDPLPQRVIQDLHNTYGKLHFIVLRGQNDAAAFAAGLQGRLVQPCLAEGAEAAALGKLTRIEELIKR